MALLPLLLLAASQRSEAAEPRTPIAPAYQWTGFYFGGHVGYAGGQTDYVVSDPMPRASGYHPGTLIGGLHTGYNWLLPSHFLVGIEADVSFPNYLGADDLLSFAESPGGRIIQRHDFSGSLRGRVGYARERWLYYVSGGLAFAQSRFLQFEPDSTDLGTAAKTVRLQPGWTAGGGVEVGLDRDWTARLEYFYSRFGTAGATFPSGASYDASFDNHAIRIGLTRRFGQTGPESGGGDILLQPGTWEVHGQTTYIQQGYPRFRAAYTGENSFTPWAQTRETWSASGFLGVRLWEGGELYYNPELFQGFGLHSTSGAGGYPNGEAQKSNFAYPHYTTSRLFLRQSYGLGGEQENVESAYGQMGGKRDIDRITFQAGKFAVHDVFDNNAYASDPRVHFMNWSIWAAGAFDYPADLVGLTYGAFAELNRKDWAIRTGYFLIGSRPNTNNFDTAVFRRGGYVAEYEGRYSFLGQPGKIRLIGWLHNSFSGGYREAVDLALAQGADPNDAIEQTFRSRIKYGYVVNLEQALTTDIGLFARWSWNNGQNQITAFTDIDSSISAGLAIKGTAWGRPSDTFGIAGAVNGLSREHRDFLAIGGLGILIGDGQLNYRQERVFETYYAFPVLPSTTLTLDYQLLTNPAYNADRGPISIFAARVHAEF